ncbi:unnamed protein product [Spodoptera littoralis]|uniref:Chitin-binding type-2 domain-containing protein n=1 Tax=Spodoptera littoralis TaxID=7109 RepID=A0A9P0IB96_SPOLI|nr:unnamed protein product [Spodoptera littoralis]CAH1643064.1 unnamed protein product [Spodoptera littoralis]
MAGNALVTPLVFQVSMGDADCLPSESLLILAALGLALARPNDESDPMGRYLEPHPDCPPAETHFLLPHEYDCTKFYYCEYGLKYIEPRDCAPGTEFNAQIQVCVHPSQSGCHLPGPGPWPSSSSTSTSGTTTTQTPSTTTTPASTTTTTTPAPTTTTTTTTTPAPTTTTTTTTTTPAPTTTSTTTTTTTPAPTTTTTTTTTPAPTTTSTTTPAPTTTSTTTTTTTGQPISSTTQVSSSTTGVPSSSIAPPDCDFLDNGCPADFDVHWLLPHEVYCNKFYYCDKGQLVERICAAGTVFSPIVGVCVHPWDYDCGDKGIADPPTTENPPIDDNDKPCNGTDNDIGEVLDNGCPADFDVHHLLPHETECDKFYYCVHGEKVERSCAPGTHFNYEIQVCDWPHNVNCVPGGGDINPGSGEGSSSESIEINDPNPGCNGNCPPDGGNDNDFVPLPNGCPADFDIHHLLPHESDCGKFYYCVHGQKVETSCGPGTHFNPVLQVCDWPQNAGCEQSSNCPGGNNCPGEGGDQPGDGGDQPGDGGDQPGCGGSCPGDGGDQPGDGGDQPGDGGDQPGCSGNCPGDGGDQPGDGGDQPGDGDDQPGDCNDNDFVPLPNGCPADFDIHHLLPHESDCGKFYYCVHGQKVETSCAPGTHFNPVLQVCDWPQYAGCEQSSNCPGGNNCPGEGGDQPGDGGDQPGCGGTCPGDGGDQPGDGGDQPGDGGDQPGGNDNDFIPLPNGCPADFDIHHLLPHESDCSKFYYCVHGQKVETSCGPGTHFNPVLQVCDWPHNAGCEQSSNCPGDNNCPGDGGDQPGDGGDQPGDGGDQPGCGGSCPGDGGDQPGDGGDQPGDGGDQPGDGGNQPGCDGSCPGDGGENPGGDLPGDNNPCINECNVAPWASDDCDKYWICVGDQKVQVTCSEGLHFNPVTLTCDFHCNSGCERRNIELTEHYDGVKVFLPWNKLSSEMKRLLTMDEL